MLVPHKTGNAPEEPVLEEPAFGSRRLVKTILDSRHRHVLPDMPLVLQCGGRRPQELLEMGHAPFRVPKKFRSDGDAPRPVDLPPGKQGTPHPHRLRMIRVIEHLFRSDVVDQGDRHILAFPLKLGIGKKSPVRRSGMGLIRDEIHILRDHTALRKAPIQLKSNDRGGDRVR